jgi:hypothetical protein
MITRRTSLFGALLLSAIASLALGSTAGAQESPTTSRIESASRVPLKY